MPYEKILGLVETRHLDITTVSLAEITGDFLRYVSNLEQQHLKPDQLADFIAVAAKLILIKSKALLPSLALTEEEAADIKDLERRLKIYRTYKQASCDIQRLWKNKNYCYLGGFSAKREIKFTEPGNLSFGVLSDAFKILISELQKITITYQRSEIKLISLEEKIKELISRFQGKQARAFSGLAGRSSRGEIVVTFLAMLHLLKGRSIVARQSEQFGEIYLEKLYESR